MRFRSSSSARTQPIPGLGVQEFFNAYYGKASQATMLYYLGLASQVLAIVALMFVVNWKVVRLFYGEDWKAPAGFMTKAEAEKAEKAEDAEPADPSGSEEPNPNIRKKDRKKARK